MIIGITGNDTEEDVRHFLSQGADKVLLKPITIRDLEKCVHLYRKKLPKF